MEDTALLDEDPWAEDEEEIPAHFNDRGGLQWNTALCPRCQEADETTYHQLWECPANAEIEGTRMDMAVKAGAEWREAPCFWLRGLPPQRWTAQYCMQPIRGQAQYEGCSPEAPLDLPVGAAVATDGFGESVL